MNIATDEFGNPFLIVREQQQKQRLQGQAAHRANILAACAVADTLRTSLGPKGMDKIIVSADGQVTVTNDGATILSKMSVEHQCARLLVELSQSQDAEIGDGTTGVVVLAGALLTNALHLLEKGIHPLTIADGYETASQIAVQRLQQIVLKKNVYGEDRELLVHAAATALGSKVVSSQQRHLAEVCVQAVLSVADRERGDVNFDLIKVDGKAGGLLEETQLLHGVVLHKEMSHSQMQKDIKNAKIAILTCPFEPPKPKTKHKLEIRSVEDYKKLQAAEQKYFTDMVKKVKEAGANFVICQWGFDDEANHLLLHEGLPALRWIGGAELEMVAIATGGRIVPRWEELTPDKLGSAAAVKEISTGTLGDKLVVIEGCGKTTKAVTVVVCGGNQIVVAEAERCMHDALCVVRNLLRDPRVVGGGGSSELCAAAAVEAAADKISGVQQFSVRAFADALTSVVEALAENCGLHAIEEVQLVKSLQITENYPYLGLDCMQKGTRDMLKQNVLESYSSKVNQILLATQVVKMILKIDDVIVPNDI